MSREAVEDLTTLYDYTLETLQLTLQAFQTKSKPKSKEVMDHEDQIDIMVRQYRKKHVQRFRNLEPGIDDDLFVDILSNVERIGDHCQNIVQNVLYDQYYYEVSAKTP
jgi:phosphate:Na+ symporter